MQIILGAHETIVKINSQSIKIDYIQHFITTHFPDRTIEKNTIYIPKSKYNYHHRTFLLKWLYSLYFKKTNNNIPQLKESLINRQEKPIRIFVQKSIIHKITYTPTTKEFINITIEPANFTIVHSIKTHLKTPIKLYATYLSISIESNAVKQLFLELINSQSIINIPHVHLFDKNKINIFLHKRVSLISHIKAAHSILGSVPQDSAKTLKKHYKKLAKEFHPDKAIIQDEQTIAIYTKKFQNILNAYEVLLEHAI